LDVGDENDASVAVMRNAAAADNFAQQLRKLYCIFRAEVTGERDWGMQPIPMYDGGTNPWGRTFQPVWPKIARHIVELGVDPVEYMRAQFMEARVASCVPLPTQFYSKAATERYRRVRRNAQVWLQSVKEFEFASIRTECAILQRMGRDGAKGLEMSLMNTAAVQASPLMRYCVAAAHSMPAPQVYWRASALRQYAFRADDYDAVWGDIIPTELRAAGRSLRQQLLG
jgi:hypothetical protein